MGSCKSFSTPSVSSSRRPPARGLPSHSARARAVLEGRHYFTHEDVQAIAYGVLGHRETEAHRQTPTGGVVELHLAAHRAGEPPGDCQAEADTRLVGAYAFGAANKRLDKRGNQLWGEFLAGVLDSEPTLLG